MSQLTHNPFAEQLEVVATLKDRVIHASIEEMREQDRLTSALRDALESGITPDALSNACGLPPDEIKRRVAAGVSGV